MKSERSTGAGRGSTAPDDSGVGDIHVIADETHIAEVPLASRATGLSARAHRRFDIASNVFLAVLALSWVGAVIWGEPRSAADANPLSRTTRAVGAALTNSDAPATAFITDAMLKSLAFRGTSGKLLARFETPGDSVPADSLPEGPRAAPRSLFGPSRP